ncbi:hypothetical protein [Actinoplanes friuliensis]|uniref:Knr4/Smi1-like domain-containing protein n=1 Tax=Actinoplanes friuliensis DSM 7358 TaxID=1246995 RepID=U5W321_9ACTN|nr:hypothetical protein [Actinoplanes friuliensis]AGZ43412.1 hypothetical protein AFR_25740 [Actinoplanes friuliensis DSM 7358]
MNHRDDRGPIHDRVLDALAAETGASPRLGPGHDWAAVEASLGGLRLPADYKRLVDAFPHGEFGGLVRVVRPGVPDGPESAYPEYYLRLLDDLREQREIEWGIYPHPLYPERGGLLPWGDTLSGQLIFWLTEGDDPDAWPVVWTDRGFEEWQLRRRSMSEFLLELITDPAVERPGLPAGGSGFRAFGGGATAAPIGLLAGHAVPAGSSADQEAPIGFSADHAEPEDAVDGLLEALGTMPIEEPTLEWFVRAGEWGFMFPADYRTFHDTLGPGLFCDIGIFGPGAPEGWNAADLLRAGRAAAEAAGLDHLRFHPDPGGLVPWGMTQDGWLLGWAARHPDPDLWCVAALGPGFVRIDWPELSFSEFLLFHAGIRDGYDVALPDRPRWSGPPTFRGLAD